jgi:hypothetical protein
VSRHGEIRAFESDAASGDGRDDSGRSLTTIYSHGHDNKVSAEEVQENALCIMEISSALGKLVTSHHELVRSNS